jgi:hypothetical protein
MAERLAKHALLVRTSSLGRFHEDVAKSLNSLGFLYLSINIFYVAFGGV